MVKTITATTLLSVVLSVSLLLLVPQPCHGFAAWLKCYVDLQDETEVIMNNRIVMHEAASNDNTVVIQVQRQSSGDDWFDTLTYPANESSTIMVRVVPKETVQRDNDMQFVVESLSQGAQFTHPRMCEGRRSHGRAGHVVTLEIDGTTPTVELLAGHAAGHEAVKLTAVTVLQREDVAVAAEQATEL